VIALNQTLHEDVDEAADAAAVAAININEGWPE